MLNRSRVLCVALVSFASGCGERASESFEQVASLHAAPDLLLTGMWVEDEGAHRWLRIERQPDHGFVVNGGTWRGEPRERPSARGSRVGALLTLDAPIAGLTQLHLCRFDGRGLLLAEHGTWFEGDARSTPRGAVFRRVEMLDGSEGIVEPLPAGFWQLDGVEPATLEIQPTGVRGRYRLRRSSLTQHPSIAHEFTTATWESTELSCETPLLGERRWRVHRAGEELWLVPLTERAESPADIRFRFVSTVRRPGATPMGILAPPDEPYEDEPQY